jgi:predicted RNase H-like HicB family nuclease
MAATEEHTTTSNDHARAHMVAYQGLNFFAVQPDLLGEQLQPTKHLPLQLMDRYLSEALKTATLEKIAEDDVWFAEIPHFQGVYASDADIEECGKQLRDVLFNWLVLKIEQNDRDIPVLAGINLNVI